MAARQKHKPQEEESLRSEMDDQERRTLSVAKEKSRPQEAADTAEQEEVHKTFKMITSVYDS